MFKIQTLNKISSRGLELLPHDSYEIASEIVSPDAIIVRSAKMHDMDIPGSVKAIARAGAGYNNIPVEKCTEMGIVVFNTPGANANAVKELVILGLLAASRKVFQASTWVQGIKGKGGEVSKLVEKEKENFAGPELLGKKIGIIGLGAIGVMVANDCVSLGMDVSGYDPFISVDAAWGLSREVRKSLSLDSLIAESDYLSIHVPLSDKTMNMINSDKIALMKQGVRIVNFARGGLIDNSAILSAITAGKVAAYVTDFPEDELLGNDSVICIPHLGASTPESEENCAVMAARQIRNYLENGTIVNSVNFPDCTLTGTGNARFVIGNRNIPNIIGQLTAIIAEFNLNISDMLNKHRDDYAYTIIDTDCSDDSVKSAVINRMKEIDGVLMARVI